MAAAPRHHAVTVAAATVGPVFDYYYYHFCMPL